MKGVVVTTNHEVRVEDFSDPLYKTVGSAVGGYIVVMKDGYRNGEPDIVGLDDSEVERVKYTISTLMSMMNLQPKGDNT